MLYKDCFNIFLIFNFRNDKYNISTILSSISISWINFSLLSLMTFILTFDQFLRDIWSYWKLSTHLVVIFWHLWIFYQVSIIILFNSSSFIDQFYNLKICWCKNLTSQSNIIVKWSEVGQVRLFIWRLEIDHPIMIKTKTYPFSP